VIFVMKEIIFTGKCSSNKEDITNGRYHCNRNFT